MGDKGRQTINAFFFLSHQEVPKRQVVVTLSFITLINEVLRRYLIPNT